MSRTTIEFNSGADAQLERLGQSLETKSKAEVVRNALSLYDYVVKELQRKPNISLGFVDEGQGNQIDRIIIVPGIYRPEPVAVADEEVG